jgi:hypothetical protein
MALDEITKKIIVIVNKWSWVVEVQTRLRINTAISLLFSIEPR